ncbi:MAG: helix-turn-helix transcriptional regulator [Lachnospiraceae bacterium]|nr:helix-turn-helix transcriptional regulator [Lachnospiraceae bacterium]
MGIAEKLLINLDNSITDVALNSGFSSMSSFIRMFKQIKGCTPTEFRSMYRSNVKRQ